MIKVQCNKCKAIMDCPNIPDNASPCLIKGECTVCGARVINYDVDTNRWLKKSK